MNIFIKHLCSMLLGLVMVLSFGACSSPESQDSGEYLSELTQTESFPVRLELSDNSYLISTRPRRLTVLSADLVQALGDMGAASLISGVCDDAPQDVAVSGAKSCGTSLDPDLDQIIASKPDWVITSSPLRQSQVDALKEQQIEVITFSQPQTLEEIYDRYRQLFTLCYGLEGTSKSTEFLNDFQARLETAINPAAEYAKLSGSKTAVYLAQLDLTMATGETFEGQLLDAMGLQNLGELGSRWNYPEVEAEFLDPQILFYDSNTISLEEIEQSEIYGNCTAVQSGNVFAVDFSAIRLRGLPMISALEAMAQQAYPQAYQ